MAFQLPVAQQIEIEVLHAWGKDPQPVRVGERGKVYL